ncbi:MAG: hypothetical protein ABWX97_00135 [Domibacillus tundrae]
MIQSVIEANSKKVFIEDVLYQSVSEYSRVSGMLVTTICYRLSSPYYPKYLYVDEKGNPLSKITLEKQPMSRKAKPIQVNEKQYVSVSEAVKDLRIGRATLLNRLKSADFPKYKYL